MSMPIRCRFAVRLTLLLAVGLLTLASAAGCQSQKKQPAGAKLDEIRAAYQSQQYDQAYRLGASAARGNSPVAQQAAYMAGMSAYKLGNLPAAIGHLSHASRSSDQAMAGDALATLGLIYAQQNNHLRASQVLYDASTRLTGQARANALFYAAVSEQKVGRWADARAHLSLARAASNDPAFKRQVDEQFAVTGYSLQVGAFGDRANADRAILRWRQQVAGRSMGQPRLVPQQSADGQTVLAVQVGQFSSYATALMARQELGDIDVIIVPLR